MADGILENGGNDPDADIEVDLEDDGKPKEAALEYSDDEENLVPVFMATEKGKKALKEISKQVIEDFDAMWEGNEEYRMRMADDWKIFAGQLPKKTFPWDKSANAHLPLMLENINRVTTRAYHELFGDWRNVIQVQRVGPDDDNVAAILSRHVNWQFNEQISDFKRQQARGVLIFYTVGDVTCHSYYDRYCRTNAHEILTCDEFVTPFAHVTTKPDYSDLPFYAKVLHRYRHQMQQMKEVWYGVDEVIDREAPFWDDEPSSEYARGVNETQGIEVTDSKRSNAYKLIQYEGWMSLPGRDEDRFCQAIVDYNTKAILSLTIHEEEDWQDRERFERQMAEMQMYSDMMGQYEQAAAQHQAMSQAHSEISMEIGAIAMDPQHGADIERALGPLPPAPQPPPLPTWMAEAGHSPEAPVLEPDPVRKKPLYMFTHGVCIEPLVGNLGLSYGRQQADHNRAVDTWISQFTDAATLANSWSLITTGSAEFDSDFRIQPGKVNKLKNVMAGEIDKHIKELRPGPANPQLMELVGLVWDKAQSSIQSDPVLSGAAGKSGETFRGHNSRVEQATKQLSVSTRWYADFLALIAKNNAKLNYTFLPDEEIIQVNNDRVGHMEELKIGRKLYERNYQIRFTSDLDFATEDQKIAKADEVLQMTTAVPPLQGNPRFVYLALKDSLEARGKYDLVQALGAPPEPPQVPFGTPPAPPPGMIPGQPPPGGPEQP